jgi:hypothetical protein
MRGTHTLIRGSARPAQAFVSAQPPSGRQYTDGNSSQRVVTRAHSPPSG